jgi:hypothetical protein
VCVCSAWVCSSSFFVDGGKSGKKVGRIGSEARFATARACFGEKKDKMLQYKQNKTRRDDVESCVNLLTQNKPGPRPSDNK